VLCKINVAFKLRLTVEIPRAFQSIATWVIALVPRVYQNSNPRWQLVFWHVRVPGKNSALLEIFTHLRDLPKAGKYSEIIFRSAELSQDILLPESGKIPTFFKRRMKLILRSW